MITKIFWLSVLLLISPSVVFAQDNWVKEEIGWIKKDYRKSDVVARIKITEQKIVDTIGNPTPNGGGYANYLVTGKIIKSYKGKFKDDAKISFYRMVEGLREDQLLREEIYFLKFVKQNRLVEVEENSAREPRDDFDSGLVKLQTDHVKNLSIRQPLEEKRQILQSILNHKNFVEEKLATDKLSKETAREKTTPPLRFLINSIVLKNLLSSANLTFQSKKVSFVREKKTKTPNRNLIEIQEFLLQDETDFQVNLLMEGEALLVVYRFWLVNGKWEIVDFNFSPTGH